MPDTTELKVVGYADGDTGLYVIAAVVDGGLVPIQVAKQGHVDAAAAAAAADSPTAKSGSRSKA